MAHSVHHIFVTKQKRMNLISIYMSVCLVLGAHTFLNNQDAGFYLVSKETRQEMTKCCTGKQCEWPVLAEQACGIMLPNCLNVSPMRLYSVVFGTPSG